MNGRLSDIILKEKHARTIRGMNKPTEWFQRECFEIYFVLNMAILYIYIAKF